MIRVQGGCCECVHACTSPIHLHALVVRVLCVCTLNPPAVSHTSHSHSNVFAPHARFKTQSSGSVSYVVVVVVLVGVVVVVVECSTTQHTHAHTRSSHEWMCAYKRRTHAHFLTRSGACKTCDTRRTRHTRPSEHIAL